MNTSSKKEPVIQTLIDLLRGGLDFVLDGIDWMIGLFALSDDERLQAGILLSRDEQDDTVD